MDKHAGDLNFLNRYWRLFVTPEIDVLLLDLRSPG